MSRIEKARPASAKKRRRPSKKLVAGLESLAAALPQANAEAGGATADGAALGQARLIRQKTLKTRPGAMKRKERLERAERERFGKNMAQMVGTPAAGNAPRSENPLQVTPLMSNGPAAEPASAAAATGSRWAALRGFISQTMEHSAEFDKTAS